jgi:NADPH:quinone reductase-like Zn-dependent oxidoreductase
VSGGAGSVSQYVIQFAKARGATVITTISSEDKAKAAREAGADHCIDYKREDVGQRVAEITGKRGVDAIIEMDLTANAKLIPAVLRPKGRVIVYGTGRSHHPELLLPRQFHPAAVLPGLSARCRATRARGDRHHASPRSRETTQSRWTHLPAGRNRSRA